MQYLDAFPQIEQHASAGDALLILRLERFNEVCSSKGVLQNLHVDISRAVLRRERPATHCMFDDQDDTKFTSDANQLPVQLGKLGSVLKVIIFGSVDLIDGDEWIRRGK
jgi:hypothetical protein